MALPPIGAARPAMNGLITGNPISRPSLAPGGSQPGVANADQTGFGAQIADALKSVEQSQSVADGLAQQAATGQLSDVHDYMIAATQAQLSTELTVAVRNKALESFNDIMRMQI